MERLGSTVQTDILIFGVSGFLGQGSDWDIFKSNLSHEFELKTLDLFAPNILNTTNSNNFDFVNYLLQQIEFAAKNYKRKIYLGYSFGGRLGLKLMQQKPDLFEHWVFVSTGVGLPENDHSERALRLEHDNNWAQKISLENWTPFLNDWNAQSIFKGSQAEPERLASHYDFTLLRHALLSQSLAVQPDFRTLVKEHKSKISWLVGKKDEKYLKMADEMLRLGCLEKFETLNGAHRLTYDAPLEIADFFNKNKTNIC